MGQDRLWKQLNKGGKFKVEKIFVCYLSIAFNRLVLLRFQKLRRWKIKKIRAVR